MADEQRMRVQIDLQDTNGQYYRFDGLGPDLVGPWIINTVPKLSPEFGQLSGNATIRVWPPEGRK